MVGPDDEKNLRTCGMLLLVFAFVVWTYGLWWASSLLGR